MLDKKPNKIFNLVYDQSPKIINDKQLDPSHREILRALYQILKDVASCTYSNKKLSENTGVPIRTLDRKLNDLEALDFIIRTGVNYRRKFMLGARFTNESKVVQSRHGGVIVQKHGRSMAKSNAMVAYNLNSISKFKEKGFSNQPQGQPHDPAYQETAGREKANKAAYDWHKSRNNIIPDHLQYLAFV